MKHIYTEESIPIPDDAELTCTNRLVKVKGKYGELEKDFRHMAIEVTIDEENKRLRCGMWLATPTQRAIVRTFCSHVSNMIKGVTRKFQYKMRLVYNHFPININLASGGTIVELRNFLGEKRTRIIKLLPGVLCAKGQLKDELVLSGIDIESVSRSCALIHQSALVRRKDIRQFLDGVYVSERTLVDVEA